MKTLTKKQIMKDCNIISRILFASVFIAAGTIVPVLLIVFEFDLQNFDVRNVVLTGLFCGFLLVTFGLSIDLKQFFNVLRTLECIKNNLVIEVDKVVDKYMAGDDRYCLQFEYNYEINTFNNVWKRAKIGEQYYVMRLNKDEVKFYPVRSWTLDQDLQKCLINGHRNSQKAEAEVWEE
ncbi:MAG: hypothetical protein ACI37Z_03610 [Candidatus Gastranaerophilaceae bacterium]